MMNGRNMELPGQNPRIHPNGKYRIPRSGQFQDSEQEHHRPIPQWERNFCKRVCKTPWKAICEAQKIAYLYPKVDKWAASAAEEAYELEKARYWAEINNLPFDTPYPDPDEYHDIVDHDAADDLELIEDLFKDLETVKGGGGGGVICWDAFHLANNYVPGWEVDGQQCNKIEPTGWGVDDEHRYDTFEPTGWEVGGQRCSNFEPTGWGHEEVRNKYDIKPTGWGDENEANGTDDVNRSGYNCGGYQASRDCSYGCGKKEFGGRRYRGRRKAFYAVNSSVNWKAQRESSWQWQKTVS